MKTATLRVGATLAVLLASGCGVPLSGSDGETYTLTAVVTITDDGWFSMEFPLCQGDRDVSLGVDASDPHTHGKIENVLEGRAPDSSVVEFDVNPTTIAAQSLTSDIPAARDNLTYDPRPTELDDVGSFWVLTPRGYIAGFLRRVHEETGWKPGERWTWVPTGELGMGDFRPFEPADEQVLADYCANALAAEAAR